MSQNIDARLHRYRQPGDIGRVREYRLALRMRSFDERSRLVERHGQNPNLAADDGADPPLMNHDRAIGHRRFIRYGYMRA